MRKGPDSKAGRLPPPKDKPADKPAEKSGAASPRKRRTRRARVGIAHTLGRARQIRRAKGRSKDRCTRQNGGCRAGFGLARAAP